ncbi:MAG: nucleotide exchange factor GrpE [Rhodothermales bacterium]|nr:nucleotide exchange factor GrpE [Rhodothermales bacterium]
MSEEIVSQASTNDPENVVPVDLVDSKAEILEDTANVDPQAQSPAPEVELAQVKDQLLRITAEFQNYRRRTEQSRIQDTALGKSIVLQQILGVFDDLGRSLDAAKDLAGNQDVDVKSSYEALRSGMNLVYKNFTDELKRLGLTEIEAVGHEFDEALHEALMQQPGGDGVEPGTIISEVQKGYMFGDRVLRHSKVIVAQ